MKNVTVFCSCVINSLGLIRALGEAGYTIECIVYGNNRNYILGSRYIHSSMGFNSCEEATEYLVNEYPVKKVRPILFTIPDPPAYYVDLHQEVLSKKFVLFSAGKAGNVVYWMDKQHISDLARKYGLTVPWTIKLSKKDNIPDKLTFPVFTKSAKSTEGGKVDERICNSIDELEEKISSMVAEEFILMQFIRKVKEINYFGIAIKGRVYIDYYDVRERFPNDGYGYYNSFHKCDRDDLYDRIVNMIKETQYQGLFDVEFLVGEDGKMYFTEVNFRVDGEVYKLTPGINLPDNWCKLVELPEERLPEELETKKNHFVGMTEVDDFKVSVLSGKINMLVWFWQFLKADRRMLFSIKDPKPLLIKIGESARRMVSKKVH